MIPQRVRDIIRRKYEAGEFSPSITPETFKLHVADSGGYDVCDNATLEFVGEKVFLIFRCDYALDEHGQYNWKEEGRFELRFV